LDLAPLRLIIMSYFDNVYYILLEVPRRLEIRSIHNI